MSCNTTTLVELQEECIANKLQHHIPLCVTMNEHVRYQASCGVIINDTNTLVSYFYPSLLSFATPIVPASTSKIKYDEQLVLDSFIVKMLKAHKTVTYTQLLMYLEKELTC
uniref:Pentafunctional AROM polypeptide n=1 Tax=Lygus hesperus TaxID=30085 RepID=A0A0A9Z2S0_LYGHE